MPRYMLDTDICSYVMKRSHPALLERLRQTLVNDVCISIITKAELLFGVEISPRRQQNEAALNAFLTYVESLPLPDHAARHYAKITADLKTSGRITVGNGRFL